MNTILSSNRISLFERATEAINHFTSNISEEESLTIHRFLYRFNFHRAWELNTKQKGREEIDLAYGLIKCLLEIAYNCETDSVQSLEMFMNDCGNLFLPTLDNHFPLVHKCQEQAFRNYFVSNYFPSPDSGRGTVVIVFDQELEGFLTELEEILVELEQLEAVHEN